MLLNYTTICTLFLNHSLPVGLGEHVLKMVKLLTHHHTFADLHLFKQQEWKEGVAYSYDIAYSFGINFIFSKYKAGFLER